MTKDLAASVRARLLNITNMAPKQRGAEQAAPDQEAGKP